MQVTEVLANFVGEAKFERSLPRELEWQRKLCLIASAAFF